MALQGITLTPAQQAKVDSITAKTRAQMPAMTPGTPPSDADRQKMMSLSTASLKEVRTVLTPDQQAIYDKNVAAIQQQMQQRMQGGATPARRAGARRPRPNPRRRPSRKEPAQSPDFIRNWSAPDGQRRTWSATRSAGAFSGRTHRFSRTSNTAGSPRTQSPEWMQMFGSKVTTMSSLS